MKIQIYLILLLTICFNSYLFAAPKEQNRRELSDRKMWRAFNEMSQEERNKMRKLQREDSEKFNKIINERITKIEQTERQNHETITNIVNKYKDASESEKVTLKTELQKHLKGRYLERLELNRKNIDEMRKRVETLDKELAEREKDADRFTQEQAERILSGKRPQKERRPHKQRQNRRKDKE